MATPLARRGLWKGHRRRVAVLCPGDCDVCQLHVHSKPDHMLLSNKPCEISMLAFPGIRDILEGEPRAVAAFASHCRGANAAGRLPSAMQMRRRPPHAQARSAWSAGSRFQSHKTCPIWAKIHLQVTSLENDLQSSMFPKVVRPWVRHKQVGPEGHHLYEEGTVVTAFKLSSSSNPRGRQHLPSSRSPRG